MHACIPSGTLRTLHPISALHPSVQGQPTHTPSPLATGHFSSSDHAFKSPGELLKTPPLHFTVCVFQELLGHFLFEREKPETSTDRGSDSECSPIGWFVPQLPATAAAGQGWGGPNQSHKSDTWEAGTQLLESSLMLPRQSVRMRTQALYYELYKQRGHTASFQVHLRFQ